jgi:hypothetical protein
MAIHIAHQKASETATEPCKVHGYDMFLETKYVGCVVATGEHNGYDDSDFYAVVWDEATGGFIEVTYATTRGWTYGNSASVDAPADLIEKYRAACAAKAKAAALARAKCRVCKGATVVATRTLKVKGNKVAEGTKGVVIWYGADKYRRGAYRAGVRFEGMADALFIDAASLEVVLDAAA